MNVNPANEWTGLLNSQRWKFYTFLQTPLHVCWLFSKVTQIKLRQLLKCYCKTDLEIKSIFSTIKVKNNSFSMKDSVLHSLHSCVVYKMMFLFVLFFSLLLVCCDYVSTIVIILCSQSIPIFKLLSKHKIYGIIL